MRNQAARKRLLAWALALAALGFVAYVVPIRDRCVDPAARGAPAPRVALSRDEGECTLHRSTGDERLSPEACAKLDCEPGLASTLARARVSMVVGLGLTYLLGTLAWALRWHALLRLANVRVSVWQAWRVTLEAQAGGVLLPGGVGGDALRVGSIVGKGAPAATVVASVLLDRAIGLTTLAGLAAALAAAFDPRSVGPAVFVLAAIPVGFAVGIALLRVDALRRAKFLEHRLVARSVKPVLEYLGDPRAPRAILAGLATSLVVSAIQLAIIRGLCSALLSEPTVERWVYTGSAIAFMIGAIPALPGAWGTGDAAFIFFLARAGIGAPTALAVSLLYRMYWYIAAATGAVSFLLRNDKGSQNTSQKTSQTDTPKP